MFDMVQELAAVHRIVQHDHAGDAVTVRLTRNYAADAADVWDALTNPERIPRWFYPISGDLKVGGTFQLEGNAGGEIRRCDRPAWLQVTFGAPESVVDVRLAEDGGTTTLELAHSVPLAMAGSGAGALFSWAPAGMERYWASASTFAARRSVIRSRRRTHPRWSSSTRVPSMPGPRQSRHREPRERTRSPALATWPSRSTPWCCSEAVRAILQAQGPVSR